MLPFFHPFDHSLDEVKDAVMSCEELRHMLRGEVMQSEKVRLCGDASYKIYRLPLYCATPAAASCRRAPAISSRQSCRIGSRKAA